MQKYIAKHSIGQFMPGDEIKGLDAKRIQALLASKAIEEYIEPVEVQQDENNELNKLKSSIIDLNAMVLQLTTERDALRVENADLKIKIESFIVPVPDALNDKPFEALQPAETQEATVQESVPSVTQAVEQQDVVSAQAHQDVTVSKPKGRPPKAQTIAETKAE